MKRLDAEGLLGRLAGRSGIEALRALAADALVVVLVIGGQIESWAGRAAEGSRGPAAAFALATTLPLLARRRFPLAAGLTVSAAVTVEAFVLRDVVRNGEVFLIALVFAVWTIGAHPVRRSAIAGGIVALILVTIAVDVTSDYFGAGDVIFAAILSVAPWLGGWTLGARTQHAAELEEHAARLELEREEQAQAAVAQERGRIARELHDVIAHSVSVMTVQAGAARMLLKHDPERAREPILAVEQTGREALAETRRLLGILRRDMAEPELEPQPGMAGLGALLERVRGAGLPVEHIVEGVPRALPPGLDLAAYRIVQEALTNTLRYAGPAQAWVTVRYRPDHVELEISHDGNTPGGNGAGGGHGLVGMRERVALYGGELEFGKHTVRGFVVRARLPLEVT